MLDMRSAWGDIISRLPMLHVSKGMMERAIDMPVACRVTVHMYVIKLGEVNVPASIAQLVERDFSKVKVQSSTLCGSTRV
jgi:hypothetical protein